MKQIKLNPMEAALILQVLAEVNRRDTFRNDPPGLVFQYENVTQNMILILTQLLQESQKKKAA